MLQFRHLRFYETKYNRCLHRRLRWPRVEIFDSWFLVVGPFELFMALGREIFPRYVINYADILKQIFFRMPSKTFFRLCVSRVGTSKKAIAAEGLLELLAKGKHKLCTNCYELFTVAFVWCLASNHVAIINRLLFCFFCMFF